MKPFAFSGKLTAHPGQRDALLEVLNDGVNKLRTLEGCISYIVYESEEDPNDLWITELWTSQEAHAASLHNDAIRAVIQRGKPLIAGMTAFKLRFAAGKY